MKHTIKLERKKNKTENPCARTHTHTHKEL